MPVDWLFDFGSTVVTRGVQELIASGRLNPAPILRRHSLGDWGDVCADDWEINDNAVINGARILSSYDTDASPDGKVWVITEADRSVTTILLPSEY